MRCRREGAALRRSRTHPTPRRAPRTPRRRGLGAVWREAGTPRPRWCQTRPENGLKSGTAGLPRGWTACQVTGTPESAVAVRDEVIRCTASATRVHGAAWADQIAATAPAVNPSPPRQPSPSAPSPRAQSKSVALRNIHCAAAKLTAAGSSGVVFSRTQRTFSRPRAPLNTSTPPGLTYKEGHTH